MWNAFRAKNKGKGYSIQQLSKMYKDSVSLERTRSRTRGWKEAAPKRGRERRKMIKACGSGCFLEPEKLGFPICNSGCSIDCRGVASAKSRARQYHYEGIAKKAELIEKKKCRY